MGKRFLLLAIGIAAMAGAAAQTNVSKPMSFDIRPTQKPPMLDVLPNSVEFTDESGNKVIDAGEACSVKMVVLNVGEGDCYNSVARIMMAGSLTDISSQDLRIPLIKAGDKAEVVFPLTAGMNTVDGELNITMQVDEPMGFGTEMVQMVVQTRKLQTPMLKVTDYAVAGAEGNQLRKKETFSLQVLLQNVDNGEAKDVAMDLELPSGVYMASGDRTDHREFGNMAGGEKRVEEYALLISSRYAGTEVPLKLKIAEKEGKFSENRVIKLKLNEEIAVRKIVVESEAPVEAKPEPARIEAYGSQGYAPQQEIAMNNGMAGGMSQTTTAPAAAEKRHSWVDSEIPVAEGRNDNTFAVVIANENYKMESKVPFALNDGEVFKEYCIKTLGMPEENVRLEKDATLNGIRAQVNWVKGVMEAYDGDARVIFYYAGHGIPDEVSKSAFLLPVDGYASDPTTGYSLDRLYAELGKFDSKGVLVMLDACFSGAKREGDMMASARGVAIKAKKGAPVGNMVVFSASTGDETAYPDKNEGHGMFTFYTLKHLKETKGECTLKELSEYVKDQVRRRSIVENSKSQTPTVTPSESVSGWESWTLK